MSFKIRIETITINTFCQQEKKFVYSCSIKLYALGFDKLWKAFSASCWLWKHFLCKNKVIKMLKKAVVS